SAAQDSMSHLIVEDRPGLRQVGQRAHRRENHPAHSSTVIIWLLRVTIPCSEGLIQHRLPVPSMLVQERAVGSKSSNLNLPERLRPNIANGASCLPGSTSSMTGMGNTALPFQTSLT